MNRVDALFHALNRRGVRYCHWKSNLRLEMGLRGQTDLDLLVDEHQRQLFREILAEYEVMPILAPPEKRYPAIENYLGFDPHNGRLFHLHVHYQLVMGEQFVKSYVLPLADRFLDSFRLQNGVKVPSPELELIVLSIRALLKYRDRDVIKDILSIRSPGLPPHILAEIYWLLAQTSLPQVSQTLAEMAWIVPGEAVAEFLRTVVATPRAGYKLFRLRQEVRRALRTYQRHGRFSAWWHYVTELWRRRTILRFRPTSKMTLSPNGLTLALVGVDGAGKTTLSREVTRWLSWKLDVRQYYLGSKQPSWLSRSLYWLFRIARRSHRTFSDRFGEHNVVAKWLEAWRHAFLQAHALSIGHDRYRRFLAGRKAAGNGVVVIFDRFPLAAALDGPKIHLAANGNKGGITAVFSRHEQHIYHHFHPPNLLVLLEVTPAVSLARKPDHVPQAIAHKNQVLGQLTAEHRQNALEANWICIDANPPLADVLVALKREIWQAFWAQQRLESGEAR
jgi:thymidylate kinase